MVYLVSLSNKQLLKEGKKMRKESVSSPAPNLAFDRTSFTKKKIIYFLQAGWHGRQLLCCSQEEKSEHFSENKKAHYWNSMLKF